MPIFHIEFVFVVRRKAEMVHINMHLNVTFRLLLHYFSLSNKTPN